ncbi:nuclear transport factor 2 family protein [Arthrobacter gyeryongensis]|uniref:Nuclear transport factor 2 family protein n=1 Tax=Arthrobacter gyeryongensis TaxID=1650592 RepID=A0ABP9S7P0_9MICC
MSNEQTPVNQALDSYAAAVHAKDVEAFAALYDDNVHIYDSWGQWQYTGIEAWRSMASEWFSSLGDERVRVEFNDVRSVAGEDVAFGHAAVTFAGISADGERLRAMTNRFTICLEKKDDAWKISHEHSSLPIDMETGKGIFAS